MSKFAALFRPLRTGGPLNKINELYGLNKPELSVPIMKLVQVHKPLSEETLRSLIADHQHLHCNLCRCKVVHGGLDGWSERLYDVAKPSYNAVTQKECRDFVYDLYVRGPLRGRMMEVKALETLKSNLKNLSFEDADSQTDVQYAVDIVCLRDNIVCAGIQVKPVSFKKQTHAVQWNLDKNKKWGHPVHYLYYNMEGNFTQESWKTTVTALKNL
jgi:hypothetical protein